MTAVPQVLGYLKWLWPEPLPPDQRVMSRALSSRPMLWPKTLPPGQKARSRAPFFQPHFQLWRGTQSKGPIISLERQKGAVGNETNTSNALWLFKPITIPPLPLSLLLIFNQREKTFVSFYVTLKYFHIPATPSYTSWFCCITNERWDSLSLVFLSLFVS